MRRSTLWACVLALIAAACSSEPGGLPSTAVGQTADAAVLVQGAVVDAGGPDTTGSQIFVRVDTPPLDLPRAGPELASADFAQGDVVPIALGASVDRAGLLEPGVAYAFFIVGANAAPFALYVHDLRSDGPAPGFQQAGFEGIRPETVLDCLVDRRGPAPHPERLGVLVKVVREAVNATFPPDLTACEYP